VTKETIVAAAAAAAAAAAGPELVLLPCMRQWWHEVHLQSQQECSGPAKRTRRA